MQGKKCNCPARKRNQQIENILKSNSRGLEPKIIKKKLNDWLIKNDYFTIKQLYMSRECDKSPYITKKGSKYFYNVQTKALENKERELERFLKRVIYTSSTKDYERQLILDVAIGYEHVIAIKLRELYKKDICVFEGVGSLLVFTDDDTLNQKPLLSIKKAVEETEEEGITNT